MPATPLAERLTYGVRTTNGEVLFSLSKERANQKVQQTYVRRLTCWLGGARYSVQGLTTRTASEPKRTASGPNGAAASSRGCSVVVRLSPPAESGMFGGGPCGGSRRWEVHRGRVD